jgi:hypothetical protein
VSDLTQAFDVFTALPTESWQVAYAVWFPSLKPSRVQQMFVPVDEFA